MRLGTRDRWLLIAVFAVSLTQFLGFGLETLGGGKLGTPIRSFGLVSTAAPLPLVFSAHNGLETFAQQYAVTLFWQNDGSEKRQRVLIDSALYSQVAGSYNRRNIYGAVFSHGPIIASKSGTALIDDILIYALCGDGVLLTEFSLPKQPNSLSVESRPNDSAKKVWTHAVRCP